MFKLGKLVAAINDEEDDTEDGAIFHAVGLIAHIGTPKARKTLIEVLRIHNDLYESLSLLDIEIMPRESHSGNLCAANRDKS